MYPKNKLAVSGQLVKKKFVHKMGIAHSMVCNIILTIDLEVGSICTVCMFTDISTFVELLLKVTKSLTPTVRYHFGGSMELNACILLLALMVYL